MAEDSSYSPAIWSGTLTFGLVSVPVSLFPAVRRQRVELRMLDEDGVPLSRRYFCSEEDKPLETEEIVRGYEIEKGQFVVVRDEELEALEPRKSRDIDLRVFVDKDEIEPILFERPYLLAPAGDSAKSYRLLAQTMEKQNKTGIATFVMREKEYLVAIIAENGILRAETLRFADEIRSPEDLGLPPKAQVSRKEVAVYEKAIRQKTAASLSTQEMTDEYNDRFEQLIEKKRRQKKEVIEVEAREPAPVVDLMTVLKESLARAS